MKRAFILIIGLLCICFGASAQLTEQQQIQKLNFVYQQIRNNYVDDVPLEPLVEEAIKATLKELDPHSQYLDREAMESLSRRLSGEYAGIGIRFLMHKDTLVVRSVIPSSPAHKAGILPNDRIISVDNQTITGITSDSVATLLRGNNDSRLSIRVVRRGKASPLNINLRRTNIEQSAVSASYRIGDVGYIAISAFSKPLANEFYAAYKNLGDIKSLILDLRNNGGGALTAAIDLTSMFLKKGELIVSTEGRDAKHDFCKTQDRISLTIPLVVIINENSASASEIFAGAIQDHDRGVVVGHTSFGKGLVQKVIDLKDGTGISLTIARYKTPSGRTIQRPYKMGKGEEYMQDSLRYAHPDSIPYDSKLIFRTLHSGRKVYGGGGITPDIYISTDSIKLSASLIGAYNSAAFEHTVIDYCDMVNPDKLKELYPTIEEFNTRFMADAELLDIFYLWAGNTEFSDTDNRFIRTMLKTVVAEIVFGENARHYIYGIGFDHTLQQSISIAANEELMHKYLTQH